MPAEATATRALGVKVGWDRATGLAFVVDVDVGGADWVFDIATAETVETAERSTRGVSDALE